MTYPAESAQIGYQNHVEDIRSFLDSRHADHYTVFNLSQRNYRGAKFSNRVSEMGPGRGTELYFLDAGVQQILLNSRNVEMDSGTISDIPIFCIRYTVYIPCNVCKNNKG